MPMQAIDLERFARARSHQCCKCRHGHGGKRPSLPPRLFSEMNVSSSRDASCYDGVIAQTKLSKTVFCHTHATRAHAWRREPRTHSRTQRARSNYMTCPALSIAPNTWPTAFLATVFSTAALHHSLRPAFFVRMAKVHLQCREPHSIQCRVTAVGHAILP